jgi:hypothetical protein
MDAHQFQTEHDVQVRRGVAIDDFSGCCQTSSNGVRRSVNEFRQACEELVPSRVAVFASLWSGQPADVSNVFRMKADLIDLLSFAGKSLGRQNL